MKYRDLKLTFTMEGVQFNTVSICLEKLVNPMPMHSHSRNSYEIHYISYGYGTLHTKDAVFDITPGTLFVTGPQIQHEQISDPDNPMTEYCLYFKINLNGKRLPDENSLPGIFMKHPFWFGMGDNVIHELMKQLLYELEAQNSGYELMLQALLQQFILQLIRKYENSADTRTDTIKKQIPSEDLTYLLIEEAFLYDYRDITLEKLAEKAGLGKRQTERLLQLHYHKTFLQKKTEARMSAAHSLLRDQKNSISSIAEQLGYSSVEHFSNAFKRYFHMTATQLRSSFERESGDN